MGENIFFSLSVKTIYDTSTNDEKLNSNVCSTPKNVLLRSCILNM